jgi:hypothetical protein
MVFNEMKRAKLDKRKGGYSLVEAWLGILGEMVNFQRKIQLHKKAVGPF